VLLAWRGADSASGWVDGLMDGLIGGQQGCRAVSGVQARF
jgi:hypothetical protein